MTFLEREISLVYRRPCVAMMMTTCVGVWLWSLSLSLLTDWCLATEFLLCQEPVCGGTPPGTVTGPDLPHILTASHRSSLLLLLPHHHHLSRLRLLSTQSAVRPLVRAQTGSVPAMFSA